MSWWRHPEALRRFRASLSSATCRIIASWQGDYREAGRTALARWTQEKFSKNWLEQGTGGDAHLGDNRSICLDRYPETVSWPGFTRGLFRLKMPKMSRRFVAGDAQRRDAAALSVQFAG